MTASQLRRVQPLWPVPSRFTAVDVPSWMQYGRCAETDPDAFFPETGERSEPAKRICGGCPVRNICREYAFDNNIHHGIWGGMSEKQRKAERRRRAQQAA